ncbi:hypothetical protein [Clostridium perfringens]|uniref:hypothetical protein n=1 Tax=Clostridium perfringens TaxID=1502 RepID=UPI0039ED5275
MTLKESDKFEKIVGEKTTKFIGKTLPYKLIVRNDGDAYVSVNCEDDDIRYIPGIFIRMDDDCFGEIIGIEIQTTSYGSLNESEIKKVIKGYQLAVETVDEVKKILGIE